MHTNLFDYQRQIVFLKEKLSASHKGFLESNSSNSRTNERTVRHKSTALAHKVLGLLRGIAILPPEELWIALGTAKKIVGENISEVLTLPRAQYSVGTDFWTEPVLRKTLNTQQLIWDKAPADIPDLWSFAIFTQESGGVPWWMGTVDAALVVKEKDRIIVLPNGIQVEE